MVSTANGNRFRNLPFVTNLFSMTSRAIKNLLGSRRDFNAECDYPDVIGPEQYKAMYDRELGARVVEVLPDECWSLDPEVYETEEQEKTPFETAWDELETKHNAYQYL